MKQRFRDIYREWMMSKKFDHEKAGTFLGISRGCSFNYAGGKTPPISRLPLYARLMDLDVEHLVKVVKRERETVRSVK
jgi:hypothetical protein